MNNEFDDIEDDEELDFVQSHEKIPVKLNITAINKHNENEGGKITLKDQIEKENAKLDDDLKFAKVYNKISVPLELIESIKVVEVLEKMKAEMKKWYFDADVQSIAKDPCVVDAMIDLYIRTANKYKENEVNKIRFIKEHKQSDIKISMSNDDCGDWKGLVTHAIEILKQTLDDCDCYTCTHGTWKRKGWDITMADDDCGGCCSWNNKYEPLPKQNLSNDDIIDQIKKEFIDLYPKNYMGGLELDGCSCEFSLNKVLKILDKYKKE